MQVSQTLNDLVGDDDNLFQNAIFRLIEVLEQAGISSIDIQILSCAAVSAYYAEHQAQYDALLHRIINK
jgi:hypothetical protein